MTDLDGKAGLVTGGGSGIGRATAAAFAGRGARVLVVDWDEAGGRRTVERIEESGGSAEFLKADVSRADDSRRMVDEAAERFGRLDFAHNNAGIEGEEAFAGEVTLEDWDRVLSVNLRGVFLAMRYEIPRMLESGGGAIVNTASVAGVVGYAPRPSYTASKHGVVGLSKAAALAYADRGIRINAVCPGVVDTPMVQRTGSGPDLTSAIPMGRLGDPGEIAEPVVWLCSGEASYVTGHALRVDGGFTAG